MAASKTCKKCNRLLTMPDDVRKHVFTKLLAKTDLARLAGVSTDLTSLSKEIKQRIEAEAENLSRGYKLNVGRIKLPVKAFNEAFQDLFPGNPSPSAYIEVQTSEHFGCEVDLYVDNVEVETPFASSPTFGTLVAAGGWSGGPLWRDRWEG
eukprot:g3066.t1